MPARGTIQILFRWWTNPSFAGISNNLERLDTSRRWPVPRRARATGDRRTGWQPAQPVLTAVSSTTNEVCSEESSVPENLMVTDPVRPPSE